MCAPGLFTRSRLFAAIQASLHGQHVQDPANRKPAISTVIYRHYEPLSASTAKDPAQQLALLVYATAAIALVAGAVLMLKNLGALAFVICAALATLAMLAPPALAYAQVHSNPFIKRRL